MLVWFKFWSLELGVMGLKLSLCCLEVYNVVLLFWRRI
jgi:hypothetical protein